LFFDEIAREYPGDYQAWRQDPVHYTPKGGETIDGLMERVGSAVAAMVEKHRSKTILVVSHVGPIRVSMAEALKIPVEWYRQLRIDYGSITGIEYGATQNNLIFANISSLTI
jgi:broad specificity phosphatase PhoE